MSKANSFYIFVAILFISLMALNSVFFKGSRSFIGVTYSKPYNINAEKSGIISTLNVVPGQEVKQGDLLIEVESPQLNLEIQKLTKQIELFKSDIKEKEQLLTSKIKLLESEKSIVLKELEGEIQLLQNEIELNQKLANQIVSSDSKNNSDSPTSLKLQINSLKERGQLELQTLDIQIADVSQEIRFEQSQIEAQMQLAEEELKWKLREERRLNKYANFQGVIENVFVKEGEEVSSFTSLISIHPTNPTSAVGYLVGKKERSRKLGETVVVKSQDQPRLQTVGTIIGFGSVVQLPVILELDNSVKVFGLEIFIELPDNNPLAVGEKLIIQ